MKQIKFKEASFKGEKTVERSFGLAAWTTATLLPIKGAVESAREVASRSSIMTGRLLETLYTKGLLTQEEVGQILDIEIISIS